MSTTRAALYLRMSLDRDGDSAGVDRQQAACRSLAEARGWQVVRTFIDNGVSATKGERAQWSALLAAARDDSFDVVVAWAVDRLVRKSSDLEQLIATGVRAATVQGDLDLTTVQGELVGGILASVARAEVRQKGERQRAANAQRAQAGQMGWTRRPFGYDKVGGQIVVVPAEAEGLQVAAHMVLAGSTLAAACRELHKRDLRTTTAPVLKDDQDEPLRGPDGKPIRGDGLPWNVKTLRYVLLNPRYSGRVLYNGADVATGTWPPILDVETQERVAERLSDVRRRVQQGTEAKYLLSGLARCGRCEAVLFASTMGSGAERRMVYRCRACKLARKLDLVDEVVEGVLLARLTRPDAAALFVEPEDVEILRREAADLRSRRDDLAGLLADGLLSTAVVRDKSTELTGRLVGIEGRISASLGESPAAKLASAQDVVAAWEGLGMRDRKAVVDTLMQVTVLPAGKGVRFSPDQVGIEWRAT